MKEADIGYKPCPTELVTMIGAVPPIEANFLEDELLCLAGDIKS